jgi:hypothetical protein
MTVAKKMTENFLKTSKVCRKKADILYRCQSSGLKAEGAGRETTAAT